MDEVPTVPQEQNPEQEKGNMTDKSRRRFFKMLGSGIAVTFVLQDAFALLTDPSGPSLVPEALADEVGGWIHIGENNQITVFTGKVEVGQNIRTSLAQVVAEELQVPMASIKMVMGDTDLTPYDAGTFGSRTTPSMGPQLRRAAATAREMALDMSATQWGIAKSNVKISQGKVTNLQTKETLTLGQLTQGKKLLKAIANDIHLTSPEQWKVAGTSVAKVNAEDILTGKHKYVSDLKLPGMLYGKILRAPSYKAAVESADLSAARAMPGVVVVQEKDFIGVAAPDRPTAEKAIKAMKVKWAELKQPSRPQIFNYLKENASGVGGRGNTQ